MWNQSESGAATPGGVTGGGGGGFFTTPTMSQGDGKSKIRRAENLVPVNIAEINRMPPGEDVLNHVEGCPAHMLSIVGIVLRAERSSTHTVYEITDHTSHPLTVRHWLDDSGETEAQKPMVENTYVRVIGSLRLIQGKRVMIVFHIRPVTDLNELTCHLLEVMHSKMMAERLMKQKMEVEVGQTSMADGGFESHSTNLGAGVMNSLPGLNMNQRKVFDIIKACKDEAGCSYNMLLQAVPSLSLPGLKDVIDFLSDEGHVYSTIDDDHFKATD